MTDKPDDNSEGTLARQESKTLVRAVFVYIAIVTLAIGYGLFTSEGRFLLQLQETAVSRGLITFLVAIVTVSIALVIAVWVIASNADPDVTKARFSYAKDVLATLVGILGTILGFYFGSADKTSPEQLSIAEVQIKSGQLVTHISGGTAPYRYTTIPTDTDSKPSNRVSKDGWIFEPIPGSLKPGGTVTIEVVDAKDRKTSKSAKYVAEEREPAPSASTTSTRPAPAPPTAAAPSQQSASPVSR